MHLACVMLHPGPSSGTKHDIAEVFGGLDEADRHRATDRTFKKLQPSCGTSQRCRYALISSALGSPGSHEVKSFGLRFGSSVTRRIAKRRESFLRRESCCLRYRYLSDRCISDCGTAQEPADPDVQGDAFLKGEEAEPRA